jgi:hypothetical protein
VIDSCAGLNDILDPGPSMKKQEYIKNQADIHVTEYGTALTTILPILFLYLNTVIVTAGTFEP